MELVYNRKELQLLMDKIINIYIYIYIVYEVSSSDSCRINS